MTNQEILEKAIQKAIAGGWKYNKFCGFSEESQIHDPVRQVIVEVLESSTDDGSIEYGDIDGRLVGGLIFNHDFAKALWGEKNHVEFIPYANPWPGKEDKLVRDSRNICDNCSASAVHTSSKRLAEEEQLCWQYHLQQMVIAEDPIKYLGDQLASPVAHKEAKE